ncbi:MAG: hypothetical protein HJJLKODD_02093 [Phycisphaerae bacterium]|nr:hypothetical protein [Phycisphaerae bacterium]
MSELHVLHGLLDYSDWANLQVLAAATHLSAAQLDQPFEIGMGTLRQTILHLYNGEAVWLKRWQGETETPWPSEDLPTPINALQQQFEALAIRRRQRIETTGFGNMQATIRYRDSRGSLFQTTPKDMVMQMIIHSIHHRAQIVNMLRRLGVGLVELDYMMRVRQPLH